MDSLYTAIPILVILIAPLLSIPFSFIQNILVRLLLIIAIILATRRGPLIALFTMLAVFTLIVERNHFILTHLPGIPSVHVPSNGPGKPSKAIPHSPDTLYEPPHPSDEDSYSVNIEKKDSLFESADDLYDNNPKLDEAPSSSDAPSFFESRGLA